MSISEQNGHRSPLREHRGVAELPGVIDDDDDVDLAHSTEAPPPLHAPSQTGWTARIEDLLRSWDAQIRCEMTAHRRRAPHFRRLGAAFKIVSAFGNLSSLAFLIMTISSGFPQDVVFNLIYGLAAFMTMVFIAGAIDIAVAPGAIADRHFTAIKDYAALSRYIGIILSIPVSSRGRATKVLKYVQDKITDIMENAPDIASTTRQLETLMADAPRHLQSPLARSPGHLEEGKTHTQSQISETPTDQQYAYFATLDQFSGDELAWQYQLDRLDDAALADDHLQREHRLRQSRKKRTGRRRSGENLSTNV